MQIPQITCHQVGSLPAGGVVFDLAQDDRGHVWAGTTAGLFASDDDAWRPVLRGYPLRQALVLAVSHRTVLAAADGGMVRSADRGKSWQRCLIPPEVERITCLAISPRFLQDGIALAGTEGQGILRSADGGRSWKFANFGLRHFQVSALAAAPSWQRKEPVFLATEQGVYYSPNGGRAWQEAGLADTPVLSLSISPEYWDDGLIAAGTAGGSVYCSRDQGKTWTASLTGTENHAPINRLLFLRSNTLLAGTDSGDVLASGDGGLTWKLQARFPGAVLSLVESGNSIFAGAGAQGLYRSPDQGTAWLVDSTLAARRVHALAQKDAAHLAVGGIEEGIWVSQDGGQNWQPATGPDGEGLACLSLAWEAEGLLAACAGGLLSIGLNKTGYEPLDGSIITLAACRQKVWAGGLDGSLWSKPRGGGEWQQANSPCRGAVISITCQDGAGQGGSMLVASQNDANRSLEFWRSDDQGGTWVQQGAEPSASTAVRSAFLDGRWFVASGSKLLTAAPHGWQRATVSGEDAPVSALLALPSIGLIAATSDRLLFTSDGLEWKRLPCEMAEFGIADLHLLSSSPSEADVRGITSDGKFFVLKIFTA